MKCGTVKLCLLLCCQKKKNRVIMYAGIMTAAMYSCTKFSTCGRFCQFQTFGIYKLFLLCPQIKMTSMSCTRVPFKHCMHFVNSRRKCSSGEVSCKHFLRCRTLMLWNTQISIPSSPAVSATCFHCVLGSVWHNALTKKLVKATTAKWKLHARSAVVG